MLATLPYDLRVSAPGSAFTTHLDVHDVIQGVCEITEITKGVSVCMLQVLTFHSRFRVR